MNLLQIKAVNTILEKVASGNIGEYLNVVEGSIMNYSLGVAAIGFFISWGMASVETIMTAQLRYTFMVKYGLMVVLLVAYKPTATLVFSALSAPSTAMMRSLAVPSSSGEKPSDVYNEMDKAIKNTGDLHKQQNNGNKPESQPVASAAPAGDPTNVTHTLNFWDMVNGAAFNKIVWNASYQFFSFVIDLLSMLVNIIYVILARYLLEILFALGPIAIAFSFFKPLEGSAIGWLKYVIVISLWIFILACIDKLNLNLGASVAFAQQNTDIGTMAESPAKQQAVESFGIFVLVFKLGLGLIKLLTPKIADMLISGSQGGALFSAVGALGTKTAAEMIKALKGIKK